MNIRVTTQYALFKNGHGRTWVPIYGKEVYIKFTERVILLISSFFNQVFEECKSKVSQFLFKLFEKGQTTRRKIDCLPTDNILVMTLIPHYPHINLLLLIEGSSDPLTDGNKNKRKSIKDLIKVKYRRSKGEGRKPRFIQTARYYGYTVRFIVACCTLKFL